MFDGSYRPNELVIPACSNCNHGTSTTDLVVSVMSRWRYSNTDVELSDHRRLAAQLRKDAPEIVEEWTKMRGVERVKARFQLAQRGVHVPPDSGLISIGPRTIPHLNLFAHKLTLAIYFVKMARPLTNSGVLSAYWRTKEDFQVGGLPKEILEMLPHHDFLKQGEWNERETFEYRYAVNEEDDIFAVAARCRVGLFFLGFAVGDRTVLGAEDGDDWIRPKDVLGVLSEERFRKRLL